MCDKTYTCETWMVTVYIWKCLTELQCSKQIMETAEVATLRKIVGESWFDPNNEDIREQCIAQLIVATGSLPS